MPFAKDPGICGRCPIRHDPVPPEGADAPLLYVAGEAPGETEAKEHRPFVGISGQLIREALTASGLDLPTQVRIYNAVTCRPTDGARNRTPFPAEIANCSEYLKRDIRAHRPAVILCAGKSALAAFAPEMASKSIGELARLSSLRFEGVPIRVVSHPAYVLRSGGKGSAAHKLFLADIQRVVDGVLGRGPAKDEIQWETFEPEQVDEYLSRFEGAGPVGFDFEASSTSPLEAGFRIGGIGLARKGYAAYLRIQDLYDWENRLSGDVIGKVRDFLQRKSEARELFVFNLRYENAVLAHLFGSELFSLRDVMQEAKTFGLSRGLKEIARIKLGEDKWNDDLEQWGEKIEAALAKLKPGRNKAGEKKPKIEDLILRGEDASYPEGGVRSVLRYFKTLEVERKLKPKKAGKGKVIDGLNTRETALRDALLWLLRKGAGFGPARLIDRTLTQVIGSYIDQGRENFDFTTAPVDIVAEYCCRDAWNTLRLHELLWQDITDRKLEEPAAIYNDHAYLGYELELNGIEWDDEEAKRLCEAYERRAVTALKQLLKQPAVKKTLNLNTQALVDIASAEDLGFLKTLWNPNATTKDATARFNSMLLTQRLKFARMIQDFASKHKAGKFTLPSLGGGARETAPTLLAKLREIEAVDKKDRLPVLERLRSTPDARNRLTQAEVMHLGQWGQWSLPGTDDEEIEACWNALRDYASASLNGPPSKWLPEVRFLFFFRLYRKVLKIRDTLDGKVGRKKVWAVQRGLQEQRVNPRLAPYFGPKGVETEIPEGCFWLYEPSYRVNAAVTRRWSSSYHTFPKNSEAKNVLVSRFHEDGLILSFDYSQMEVRMMATLAKDAALIEACDKGGDLHRTTAAMIFAKDPKDVTDVERGFAKAAVFGLLYGKGVQSFADEFLKGDLKEAEKFFSTFFGRFPDVKRFIDRMHAHVDEHGWVPTLWGDPIEIPINRDDERSVAEAHRQAQNYPVQSVSSTIAAWCIYQYVRYLRKARLQSKVFGFTHDSCDTDAPVQEVFHLAHVIPHFTEKVPRKKWGAPIKIDMELGISAGQKIKLETLEGRPFCVKTPAGRYRFEAKFKGPPDVVGAVASRLSRAASVELDLVETKTKRTEWDELFLPKRAFSFKIGKDQQVQSGVIRGEA